MPHIMDVQARIHEIVWHVKRVDGVSAIVLGGSRARGTHTPQSDIDLAIYYHPDHALDLNALDLVAAELDDSHRPGILTPIGGWGPWINGGGWLSIRAQPVDFLYRDLSQVATVIEACHSGEMEIIYQPGHPHGFVLSRQEEYRTSRCCVRCRLLLSGCRLYTPSYICAQ